MSQPVRPRHALGVLLTLFAAVVTLQSSALGATIAVTTVSDAAAPPNGLISLREAITMANNNGGANTITFDPTLFASQGNSIALGSALPDITCDLTIAGPGWSRFSIVRSGASSVPFRLLRVTVGHTVTLSGLSFSGGNASAANGSDGVANGPSPQDGQPGLGGGIYNSGTLLVTQCVFGSNFAFGGSGGNGADTTLQAGGKGADGRGGAIYSDGPSLLVDACHFEFNEAVGGAGGHGGNSVSGSAGGGGGNSGGGAYGGAVYAASGAMKMTNCSFHLNDALGGAGGDGGAKPAAGGQAAGGRGGDAQGGGIWSNAGTCTVASCTVTYGAVVPGAGGLQSNFSNRAPGGVGQGGGIYANAKLSIGNTIVAQNGAGFGVNRFNPGVNPSDVFGSFASLNFNLIRAVDPTISDFSGAADQVGSLTNPLDPLFYDQVDYSGPSIPFLPLRRNSPALDRGKDILGLGVDERGSARPVNLDDGAYPNAPGGDGSDIGAYEASAVPNVAPTSNDQTFTGAVGVPFSGVQVAAADGDLDPLTYSIVRGPMPAGLTLNADGSITGTPLAITVGAEVLFKVNDGRADSLTCKLLFNIGEASSTIVNTDLDVSSPYDGVTSLREALEYVQQSHSGTPITFDPEFFATNKVITLVQPLPVSTKFGPSSTPPPRLRHRRARASRR